MIERFREFENFKNFQNIQTSKRNIHFLKIINSKNQNKKSIYNNSEYFLRYFKFLTILLIILLTFKFNVLVPTIIKAADVSSSSVVSSTISSTSSSDSTSSDSISQQISASQAQLNQLEEQINQYQNKIQEYSRQRQTLSREINILNDNIASLNLQIQAVQLSLNQLDAEIASTTENISITQASIDNANISIGNLLRYLYQNDNQSLMEIFLKNPTLSAFFDNFNNISLLQDNLREMIIKVTNLQTQLQNQKTELLLAQADAQSIAEYRAQQKQAIINLKNQKNQILAQTKGQEANYRALVKSTQETAAEIRKKIFQLLGGGQLSFGDAYQYAKLAQGATGIDPAFLMAILDRESALGRNVGQCNYQTAMSPANRPLFLQITASLGLNPNQMTVSCPNADGIYGGAMGPAQFIPSTWLNYSQAVSAITGHNPANPWNNADAFVATALYLKDLGAANADINTQRIAAAKYYAGSRWRYYLWTYGQAVISRMLDFRNEINILNSNS